MAGSRLSDGCRNKRSPERQPRGATFLQGDEEYGIRYKYEYTRHLDILRIINTF